MVIFENTHSSRTVRRFGKKEGLGHFGQALLLLYDVWLRGHDLNVRPSGYEPVSAKYVRADHSR